MGKFSEVSGRFFWSSPAVSCPSDCLALFSIGFGPFKFVLRGVTTGYFRPEEIRLSDLPVGVRLSQPRLIDSPIVSVTVAFVSECRL